EVISAEDYLALGDDVPDNVVAPFEPSTVHQLSANALAQWMVDYGESFGWELVATAEQGQQLANEGNLVIILAQNTTENEDFAEGYEPGHVSVIIAEGGQHAAARDGDELQSPLQSQAGADNFTFSDNDEEVE